MNPMAERLVCPRCRANNFTGQATCWQCGHSLPPPEAAAAGQHGAPAASGGPAMLGGPAAFGRPAPRGLLWPIVAVAVLIVLVIGGAIGLRARTRPPAANDPRAQIEALERKLDAMGSQQPPRISDPSVLDPNSLEAQAEREKQRLIRQNHLTPDPPADAQGQVHLQGGGTLPREDWQRYRRSLGGQ